MVVDLDDAQPLDDDIQDELGEMEALQRGRSTIVKLADKEL